MGKPRPTRLLPMFRIMVALVASIVGSGLGCRSRPGAAGGDGWERVRLGYTATDAEAIGAWEWDVDNYRFLVVAVRSFPPADPLLKFEFWVDDAAADPWRYSRTESFTGGYDAQVVVFEDLTGDGLPELAAIVEDSLGSARNVFAVGARGVVDDALDHVALGWNFALDAPRPTGTGCAIRLWALEPTADSLPPGWRYLRHGPDGLGPPGPEPTTCP